MNLESPTEDDYLGIYSIMFWTLTLIGVVKYVFIALNADDHGEGGTFALYSLLCSHINIDILESKSVNSRTKFSHPYGSTIIETTSKLGKFIEKSVATQRIILFLAMSGVCMLIGDGILTPAISVLSAINGLKGPFPSVNKASVEALSVAVLLVLFLLQKFGTSRVSFLFSPIMGIWTLVTPMIGVYSLLKYYPNIFKALSPLYIVHFFLRNRRKGWQLLGGTVLCITGAEAMFADLGHFNKRSIQMAFLVTIYPSLVLTYAGQTAYLIRHPDDHSDGFYKFIPRAVYWPMLIVATLAAIVASQSLISATFSVVKQSVSLDYFPRVKIVHTSLRKEGEVYSPETNYILMVLCVLVVLCFGDGKDIGNAFGVVVILVMVITTMLLSIVTMVVWKAPAALAALYFVPFFAIEATYASAVFTKMAEGGWFPFAVSVVLAFVMFSWYYGRQRKLAHELVNRIPLDRLGDLLLPSNRVPGLCFFYSKTRDWVSPPLAHYLRTAHALRRVTIFVTLSRAPVARVNPCDRILVRELGFDGIYGCTVRYGYADGGDLLSGVLPGVEQHVRLNHGEAEVAALARAREEGAVHVRGKACFCVGKRAVFFDRVLLTFYEFLHASCRSALPSIPIPAQHRLDISMLYEGC